MFHCGSNDFFLVCFNWIRTSLAHATRVFIRDLGVREHSAHAAHRNSHASFPTTAIKNLIKFYLHWSYALNGGWVDVGCLVVFSWTWLWTTAASSTIAMAHSQFEVKTIVVVVANAKLNANKEREMKLNCVVKMHWFGGEWCSIYDSILNHFIFVLLFQFDAIVKLPSTSCKNSVVGLNYSTCLFVFSVAWIQCINS